MESLRTSNIRQVKELKLVNDSASTEVYIYILQDMYITNINKGNIYKQHIGYANTVIYITLE